MSFRSQDAAFFLRDGDKAVLVAENKPFQCLFEHPDQIENFSGQMHAGAIVARPTIKYATEGPASPGRILKFGDKVSVNGVAYLIQTPRVLDDMFSLADLAVCS